MRDATTARWLICACRTAYTAEVAEIVWRTGGEIAALVDNLGDGSFTSPLAPVVALDDLDGLDGLGDLRALDAVIPLLTPGYRHTVAAELKVQGVQRFPALVDPTSVIARTARIGTGSVINAGVIVGANTTVGEFVHVNRSASIAHDDVIEDYVSIGPGAVLAGSVTVRTGAFLGAGVTCAPERTIGANAVVGAGAVVLHDVPPGSVVVGNPAKVLRAPGTGYRDAVVPTT